MQGQRPGAPGRCPCISYLSLRLLPMQPLKRLALLLLLLTALAVPAGSRGLGTEGEAPGRRPRLVVLISIDQFRADYLVRFQDLYLPPGSLRQPGGFRFLQEQGAWYPDCRYEHFHTVT